MAKIDKIKVLICDDDGQMARSLSSYLDMHGFEAKMALTGAEVRESVLSWRPKVILSDMMLPGMTAFEIMNFIFQQESLDHKQMRFLILSGHNSRSNIEQAIRHGAHDYIVKPIKNDDLLKRLIFQCRSFRSVSEIEKSDYHKVDESSLMLHLTNLVLKQATLEQPLVKNLYHLCKMVALKMSGVRCSVIHHFGDSKGVVVTSNDDENITGYQLNLND